MTNVELVKQAYGYFETGNIDGVMSVFDPAIEWNECKGMPFVQDDGRYFGGEAIVKNVFMHLPEYFDGFQIVVSDVFGEGEKVAMEGFYQGTNKATGNPFKANVVHIWTISNGKLLRFFQAADTAVLSR